LVQVISYCGYAVTSLSPKDLEKRWIIRIELEALASRLAAQNCSQENIEYLKIFLAKMEEFIKKDEVKGYGSTNKEFHFEIYRQANNSKLLQLIQDLWRETERVRSVFQYSKERMKSSLDEHYQMLEELKKGNSENLDVLVRKHRDINWDIFKQIFAKQS